MKKSSTFIIPFFSIFFFAAPAAADSNPFTDWLNAVGSTLCWPCGIFSSIFDGINTLSTNIAVNMANQFLGLLGLGVFIYVILKIGKMLVQLKEVDVMDFLNELFKPLGRAIIAAAMLTFSVSAFTYIVSPVLQMSLILSSTVLQESGLNAEMAQVVSVNQKAGVNMQNMCNVSALMDTGLEAGEVSTKAFTDDVKEAILCLLTTITASLVVAMGMGAAMIHLGFSDTSYSIPNVFYLAAGSTIVIFYFLLQFVYPFKLLDAMIRIAFVCATMPIWIILWVFPATAGYTKKAWDMFLSGCLTFLTLSIVLAFVIAMINETIPNRDKIIEYLLAGEEKKAARVWNFTGLNFFITVFLCFLAYKAIGTASILANSFVGATDLAMGNFKDSVVNVKNKVKSVSKSVGRVAGKVVGGGKKK